MKNLGEFRESLKDTDWAWIAGFIDGEGSFGIKRHVMENKNYNRTEKGQESWTFYTPRLSVSNTDQQSVEFVANAFGSNVIRRKMTDSNLRPIYTTEICAIDKLRVVLKKLTPFLRVKKRHAEIMYQFCFIPRPSGPKRTEITHSRELIWKEFRECAEECGQAGSGRANRNLLKPSDRKRIHRLRSVTLSQAIG